MNNLDVESDSCDVSDGDLAPENNRNIASVNKNASELDLDADIVLVVSTVARIMSDGFLFAMNNLDEESDPVKTSDEPLDPENNLVVSIAKNTKTVGFLFAMSNLDDESVNNNESDGCLFDTIILFIRSDRFNISVKSLPRIASLFTIMLIVIESVNSL